MLVINQNAFTENFETVGLKKNVVLCQCHLGRVVPNRHTLAGSSDALNVASLVGGETYRGFGGSQAHQTAIRPATHQQTATNDTVGVTVD